MKAMAQGEGGAILFRRLMATQVGKRGQHTGDDDPVFIDGRKKGEEDGFDYGWRRWKGAGLQWFFSLDPIREKAKSGMDLEKIGIVGQLGRGSSKREGGSELEGRAL